MDADEYRRASREQWEGSAAGWSSRRALLQGFAMPVSRWLVDAIRPQPGHVVLELAAGPGDTGLLAAELVAPGGQLISSDFAEPMLDVARERAGELEVDNVDFRVLDAESLDLETASVDSILCRWGFMLMADPAAALGESRRVLRPGGRLALAAWDIPEANPWVTIVADELIARGLAPARDPAAPSMFAFSAPGRIETLLDTAGFTGATLEPLAFENRYRDFDEWWATSLDLGRPLALLVERLPADEVDSVRAAVRAAAEAYAQEDGALAFPARTLVAAADA